MDNRSPKLHPVQGILLLLLLLIVPITGYFVAGKTSNFSNWSFAYQRNKPASPSQAGSSQPCSQVMCGRGLIKVEVGTYSDGQKACTCTTGTGGSTVTGSVSPTPTGSVQQRCNTSCTNDAGCGEGMVCAMVNGAGKCRNSQCYGVEDCWCYKTGTPTPGPACNSTCSTDVDCGSAFICVKTAGGNKCRNPQCYGIEDCLCYSTLSTPSPVPTNPPLIYATPTPYDPYYVDNNPQPTSSPLRRATPTPYVVYVTPTIAPVFLADILTTPTPTPFSGAPTVTAPALTIDAFYDAKKQTNPLISLNGTTNANAELEVSITPDGVLATITADSMGNWSYMVPKKLTNGPKQLTVIARTANAGQTTKTETFTVVGGYQFPYAAVIFSILIIAGVGGYIVYQKKFAKKGPGEAMPNQYTPTTPQTFVPPEATPTEGTQTLGDYMQNQTPNQPVQSESSHLP